MRAPPGAGAARLALGLAGWLACAGANAQWSGSVGIDSDHRFRGVSLSNAKPVGRAALNLDVAGGGYAGVSATRIESVYGERHVEVVPYAGWVVGAGRGLQVDLGATWAHVAGDAGYDYGQGYVGLLGDRWQLRLFYAPDYAGQGLPAAYAEVDLHAPVGADATVFAHAGLLAATRVPSPGASRTRPDLSLGGAVAFGDIELQLAWSGAARPGPDPPAYRGRRAGWLLGATFHF